MSDLVGTKIVRFLMHRLISKGHKKSSCQFMAREMALISGNLPARDLPRNSVPRITNSVLEGLREDWLYQL